MIDMHGPELFKQIIYLKCAAIEMQDNLEIALNTLEKISDPSEDPSDHPIKSYAKNVLEVFETENKLRLDGLMSLIDSIENPIEQAYHLLIFLAFHPSHIDLIPRVSNQFNQTIAETP